MSPVPHEYLGGKRPLHAIIDREDYARFALATERGRIVGGPGDAPANLFPDPANLESERGQHGAMERIGRELNDDARDGVARLAEADSFTAWTALCSRRAPRAARRAGSFATRPDAERAAVAGIEIASVLWS